ncbi:MAG: pyridoxal phosphate-dependent aminotransferase, partial [Chitinophagaceae bacterium]|nr:pyridoxal phosphate-dependent aminotransferase [Chitinophagaceae bacterium]
MNLFSHENIRFDILRERAFNLRWASLAPDIIPLTAADPDFPCSPAIAEAICKYAQDRYFSYTPPEGARFFREAVAQHALEKRQVKTDPNWVLAVNSAAHGIEIVCRTLLKPGDEAIIFNPVDFLFRYNIEACGAKALSWPVSANPSLELDYSLIESQLSPKTKLLCLCNPLNPTGKVFTKQELETLGAWAKSKGLVVLSDEIWSDFVFEQQAYVSIASIDEACRPETYIVTGYSKSYGLAGLRAGTLIAPHQAGFNRIFETSAHASTVHGANIMAQVAAATALNECQTWLKEFVAHIENQRNVAVEKINAMPGMQVYAPQGCYVVFPNIRATGMSSEQLQELLLEKARVAVV